MFSPELKRAIANSIQEILQSTKHRELPKGEINFLLHVDGAESWSWANIQNNDSIKREVPQEFVRNMSFK